MSNHVLVIPAEEWSCNQRMRGLFDEPDFGKAHSEEILKMLLWMDLQTDEPHHMIDLPMPVAKPRLPDKAEMVTQEPYILTQQPAFNLVSSYKANFSIAAISALTSFALIIDGDILPVLATFTATVCFGCLGYAQRLVQAKIAQALKEQGMPK